MASEIPQELRADVKSALTAVGSVGTIGAFSKELDVAGLAACWGMLLVRYGRYFGAQLDKESARKICTAALLGLGKHYQSLKKIKKITNLLRLLPVGSLPIVGASSLVNMIFTYRYADALTRIFEKGSVDYNHLTGSINAAFEDTISVISCIDKIAALYLD